MPRPWNHADYVVESHQLKFHSEQDFKTLMSSHQELLARTRNGLIYGKYSRHFDKIRLFLGVPYAKPPVDSLRFTNPVPITAKWSPRILSTRKPPPVCLQMLPLIQSEDCLYLNVYAPSKKRLRQAKKKLAVMMWIHGGAWTFGSGEFLGVQDPSYMVQHRDVIVVTVRYRLGPMGFLVGDDGMDGNYGFLDQKMAIEWVRENIEAFGGDPDNITLWGESAGAMSLGFHLTTSDTRQSYVKSIIMESNVLGIHYKTVEQARKFGRQLCKNVECVPCTVKCLQSKPASKIMFTRRPVIPDNSRQFLADVLVWSPVVDGKLITGQPIDLFAETTRNKSIIMGYNKDETAFGMAIIDLVFENLLGTAEPVLIAPVYEKLVNIMFKSFADQVLDLYPAAGDNVTHNTNNLIQLTTDFLTICPSYRVAKTFAQRNSVYVYDFDFWAQYLPSWLFKRCQNDHICHAMELPYVFHSLQKLHLPLIPKFTEIEHALSHMVVDYFADVAMYHEMREQQSTNHDNGMNIGHQFYKRIKWPTVTPRDDLVTEYLEFTRDGRAVVMQDHPRPHHCKFWDQLEFDKKTVAEHARILLSSNEMYTRK